MCDFISIYVSGDVLLIPVNKLYVLVSKGKVRHSFGLGLLENVKSPNVRGFYFIKNFVN